MSQRPSCGSVYDLLWDVMRVKRGDTVGLAMSVAATCMWMEHARGAWEKGDAPTAIASGSLAFPGHGVGLGGIRPTARDVGLAGERAA